MQSNHFKRYKNSSNELLQRKDSAVLLKYWGSNLKIFKKVDVKLYHFYYEFIDLNGTLGNLL